jgi:hypothetical protein
VAPLEDRRTLELSHDRSSIAVRLPAGIFATHPRFQGRDFRLTDVHGNVVPQLVA